MSVAVDEGALRLEFDDYWTVVKWDDCAFRRQRAHHGKAVDVAAVDRSGPHETLLLIEIKDYPNPSTAKVPEPRDLAATCVTKVRDTLAQLLFSASSVGRPTEAETELLCRAFGSTERPLSIVLLVEDANEPPLEMLELQGELDRAFRWLPARVVTAASINDLNALEGLRIARVA